MNTFQPSQTAGIKSTFSPQEQRARANLKTENHKHPALYHPLLRQVSHQSTLSHFPSQQADSCAVYFIFLFCKVLTHCLELLCGLRGKKMSV